MKNFRIVTEGQSENNFVNRTDVQESKDILFQIQEMFKDDKGWNSEEDMIAEMAAFRRERMGLWMGYD